MRINFTRTGHGAGARKSILRVVPALTLMAVLTTAPGRAEDMFRPQPSEGGIDPRPTITSLTKSGTNAALSWYGLKGPYRVQTAASPGSGWADLTNVLASAFGNTLTLPAPGGQAFFRLQSDNSYTGSRACAGCHWNQHENHQQTVHASAYEAIAPIPSEIRQSCLPCHTVGAGKTTGFISAETTPHLSNVGCENCHGPGGAHKYGDHSLFKPAVTLASEACGGCHTDAHHPTFDEWQQSGHAHVSGELQTEFADPAGGATRQASCGPCHSGATRLAMLANYKETLNGYTNYLTLPSGQDAAACGITCVVCHDPHQKERSNQLRHPVASTNYYTFRTGAVATNVYRTNYLGIISTNTYWLNTTFANQYNAEVQICAQCHNDRGASWTTTSRPPHHSPQYNMLLGTVGQLSTGVPPSQAGAHGRMIAKQCVGCHMAAKPFVSEQKPAVTGHSFKVESYDSCRDCHPQPEGLVDFTMGAVVTQIQQVKTALDLWATSKAPAALRTYGTRAWEYTTPGSLSSGGRGPGSSEQALIPDGIKKARFNMYVVLHDGSYGVHNGPFAIELLQNALTWVRAELQ